MTKVRNYLHELGFFRCEESLPELYQLASEMAFAAGDSSSNSRFEAFDSYIPAETKDLSAGNSLIIDIGGTSTKAGVRLEKDGREYWRVLFEEKNRNLRTADDASKRRLSCFASAVAQRCAAALSTLELAPAEIKSVALVWSNPMSSVPLEESDGVSAIVSEREHYNKDEWFIEDLVDGDDLGELCLPAFREAGLLPERFLIANDCALTMKAGRLSDGGMVASTGVNGTVLMGQAESLTICNGEIGQKYLVPENLLTSADLKKEDGLSAKIECLIGGRFLPRLLVRYLRLAAEDTLPNLKPLSDDCGQSEDKWRIFRGKDISLLERGDFKGFLERREDSSLFSEDCLQQLSELTKALLQRAAQLASVVAYGTCARQLHEKDLFRVAIDTRLGREIPFFWEQLVASTHKAPQNGQTIELQLLEPTYTEAGSISVPMKGAASALDSLVA